MPSSRLQTVAVVIEVHDALTSKRLFRDIALDAIPVDAHPLTIALAIEELLWASWAELALGTTRNTQVSVPPAVTHQLADLLETPRPPPRYDLGATLASEWFSHGGLVQLGSDLRLGFWATRRLAVIARLGLRSSPPVRAPNGNIRASAAVAGLGVRVPVAASGHRRGIDLGARLDGERVTFLASADPGAVGGSGSATALLAASAVTGWLSLGSRLRIEAEAGVIAPLRPVFAVDTEQRVVGVAGVGLSVSLGISARF